jgi:hypothetical protein
MRYYRLFTLRNIFLVNLFVFILLLSRNPFGERTLIPNLAPYPDTIHYLTPIRSLIKGGPFKIVREGRSLNVNVPPLYSIIMAPFYAINFDVRMFYFANTLLSLISLYLFYLILKKITDNIWIVGITLFIFVTNYYIYWYPQWAMAENLILPMFLIGVYLLILPIKTKYIISAGLIPILTYATKYACLPFSFFYFGMYLLKIIIEKKRKLFGSVMVFFAVVVITAIPMLYFQFMASGVNPLARYVEIFVGIFNKKDSIYSQTGEVVSGSRGWFSDVFFKKNLPLYIKGVFGGSSRSLWDYSPILPKYLTLLSWLGLVWAIFKKKYRFISISLIILLVFPLIVISTFSTFDMRYIYHATPTLLIGFAFFLVLLKDLMVNKKLRILFPLMIISIFGFYLLKNAVRVKSQIVINIKYAETPWYYISVLRLNDFFTNDKIINNRKPVVISPMPPYYIDFYSNGNYELLPLDKNQEFRLSKEEAWGTNDYSDLQKLYKSYLSKSRDLYVSTYGLGNEAYLHLAFENLYKDFNLTEVYNGCYTQCNIYKLELKQ